MKASWLLAVLVVLQLALTSNKAIAEFICPVSDPGYTWSWGWVQFSKQEGSTAYCRVLGISPNWFIRCTVNTGNTCKDVDSKAWVDMGFPGTQYWADVNGDGYIDFCRTAANPPNTSTRCILGPKFDREQ